MENLNKELSKLDEKKRVIQKAITLIKEHEYRKISQLRVQQSNKSYTNIIKELIKIKEFNDNVGNNGVLYDIYITCEHKNDYVSGRYLTIYVYKHPSDTNFSERLDKIKAEMEEIADRVNHRPCSSLVKYRVYTKIKHPTTHRELERRIM